MKGLMIAGAVAVDGVMLFNSIRNDRVHVTNLSSSGFFGDKVSGKLVTEGSSGYVYLWVEMNGNIMCPRRTYIRANVEQEFNFSCSAMISETGGKFKVLTNRYPSTWVEENAKSL